MYARLNRREMCWLAAAAAAEGAIGLHSAPATAADATSLSPEEARKIAQQGYVYCFPIVQNYHSIYQLALDPSGSQYKGPPNEVHNVARVFTPADTAIITPNSDTPYSYLIMDLRAEPMVVTMPAIEKDRYYSLQLVDLYTNNVDYPGTREDGNGGGTYLIAGPDWKGKVPAGITRAVHISTPLMFSQFRTQLFDSADLDNVKKIQSGYKAQPLSAFLNQPSRAAQKIAYPSIDQSSFEPKFWQYANFLLQYCPTLPSEKDLRAEFSRIGISPGAAWPPPGMPTDVKAAVEEGRQDARKDLEVSASKLTSSVGIFGSPQEMAGKYKQRAMGAMLGIYGNTPVEAIYPGDQRDSSGKPLDTSKSNYTVTFASGRLPPVNAFWSVTMYDGRNPVSGRQPDPSLSNQLTDASRVEEKSGWRRDHVLPTQIARQGLGVQLAAGAGWPHVCCRAAVSAKTRGTRRELVYPRHTLCWRSLIVRDGYAPRAREKRRLVQSDRSPVRQCPLWRVASAPPQVESCPHA